MNARRLTAAAAGLVLAAATAFAQDQPARPASALGKITLVGCVERADQVLARENLGTTVDSLTFVLVKAEEGKASDQPGTVPPGGRQDIGKMYRLDGDVDTLNPHVGHRVEVTGTIRSEAPAGTSGRADAEPGDAGPPRMVTVESVKLLSSTCSR
jgi:hypothetical protein